MMEMVPYEEFRYVQYARAFGWTPQQVDELPLSVEPWLLPIHNAIDQVIAEKQAKAQRDAEQKAKLKHG